MLENITFAVRVDVGEHRLQVMVGVGRSLVIYRRYFGNITYLSISGRYLEDHERIEEIGVQREKKTRICHLCI